MPPWVIDAALFVMMAGLVWAISSEGLWGAALMFVNIMFAGLIAFSLYEPIAGFIAGALSFMASFADFVSVVILFVIAFSLIRTATDNIAPTMVRFPGPLYHAGRFAFAVAASWYFVGMVLCLLQMAPIHKQFLGYQWQRHALGTMGVDRFWLGYVQATSGKYLEWNPPKVFDPNSSFILRYHDHRPFGTPDPAMPGAEGSGGAAATGAATSGQAPAGQPAGTPATPAGGPATPAGGRPATPAGVIGVDTQGP